ncbi:MAG: CoA transferase, partial [Chloroflexi bacterium]|nr:CoA transferase [Chloroflexota bacterium]
MAGALDDVRVLEIAEGWSGPMCGKLLAELGAEVIKVEPPQGDWLRSYGPMKSGVSYSFQLTSANKKSVVLDIHAPKQRATLQELIQTADILIENHPVGTLARWDLDYRSVEQLNPGLIYCSITPYGQEGPLSTWAGNELTVQAMAGIMATTGPSGGPPTRAGIGLADLVGAIYSTIGILAALHYRDRTGVGQAVDIALSDCLTSYLTHFVASYIGAGRLIPRDGNRHPTSYPWAVFPAKDGLVTIASPQDVQFARLCKLMGREDILSLPQFASVDLRRKNADELDGFISQWSRTKPVQEIVQEVLGIHIPAGPIQTIDQVLSNEQFLARRMLVKVDHPTAGEMFTSGPLCKLSETPGVIDRAAPPLGQHTDEVLGSLQARLVPAIAGASVNPTNSRPRPLEGIRIADLSHATAGEY